MYICRNLEHTIQEYLSKPEILAITGPRQSGKTTLLKHIYKGLDEGVFIDFEDRAVLDIFNRDIQSFYELYAKKARYLFIDEFQYAEQGGRQLKYIYDKHQLKIIISGSSALDLTNQAVKFLVGRIFVFHLYPLSFDEYLGYKDSSLFDFYRAHKRVLDHFVYEKEDISPPVLSGEIMRILLTFYHDFVRFGGYPRVILAESAEEKKIVLKNIYNTYLLREVRDILQLSTDRQLELLIKALSHQIRSTVSYNELCQFTGLNNIKLKQHLSILEKTFLAASIGPYYTNKRTELVKARKVYFVDSGFRNHAAGNFQNITERSDRGLLNENFAASELYKRDIALRYWRTKSQAEVDFVIEKDGKIIAVEVKTTLMHNKAGKALYSFQGKYNPHRTVVASEQYSAYDKDNNILYMPLCFV